MRWTLLRCFFLIASFRCRCTYSWGWVFSSWLFTLNLQARSISFFFFLATTFFLFVCLRSWWAFYLFFFFTEFCFVISAVHSFFIDGANMRFSPTFEQRREEGWYCLSLSVFFFYVSTSKRPLSDCGIFFSFFSVFFCVFFCSLSLLRNRRQ